MSKSRFVICILVLVAPATPGTHISKNGMKSRVSSCYAVRAKIPSTGTLLIALRLEGIVCYNIGADRRALLKIPGILFGRGFSLEELELATLL